MTNMVNDGLSRVQTGGQWMKDGVGAVAAGLREEADAVARGIRHHGEPAAHKRDQSPWRAHMVELIASLAGALAAFFVSRLVRSQLRASGK